MSGGYRDIYSGILHKCGGRIKTWTKRWMVLRSDYCLYYYKDATKNHLGVISLRDTQFKIRVGQKSDVSWPKNLALENTFALVTTPRVYFMYAETKAEADEWRKVLEDAHRDLLEVTRTKSFSGFRSTTLEVDRDTAFTSKSVHEGARGSVNGGMQRPKAHSSVTESLTSTASSVFGRQFTLSSSSEMGSPLPAVREVESMYNVLQHPLVEEEKRAEQNGTVEKKEEEEEEGEGEERIFINEILYSKPPLITSARGQSTSSENEREYDYVLPPDAETPQNFSVTVADDDRRRWAEPQAKSGGSTNSFQNSPEGFYDLAGEIEISDKQKRQQQQKQQQEEESAVYDVVGPETSSVTPPTKTKSSGPPQKSSSAVVQPLPAIPPSFSASSSVPPGKDTGIIYEDVPEMTKTNRGTVEAVYDVLDTSQTTPKSKQKKEDIVAVYDLLDTSQITSKSKQKKENIVAVYDVLEDTRDTAMTQQKKGSSVYDMVGESETAVYEPVGVPVPEKQPGGEEEMYSEVGSEERTPPLTAKSVGGYVNVAAGDGETAKGEVAGSGREAAGDYVNVSHSGDTSPLLPRNIPPSPPTAPINATSTSATPTASINATSTTATPTAPINATSTTTMPTAPINATPTTATPTAPINATSTTATPTNCGEESCAIITKPQPKPRSNSRPRNADQLPSNSNTVDQLPSNKESSVPPQPAGHASSEQIPIPVHKKTDSSSSDPFPPSPSPTSPSSFPRKFTPPSPRSPRAVRPPSPLLSDRRRVAPESSPHSSTSSSPGNDSCLATSRQRTSSLKEKGILLFQRRQQEVASLSEQDNQRRKRSISMLKGVQDDESLSPDDKVLFAETLREVESERLKASEERFRWERERMQLEEERRLLQQERQRLREELENTRKEIVQS